MKKLLLISSMMAALAVAGGVNAFTVRGVGSSQCYTWNNGQNWDAKVQYALGFVSGAESILRPRITTGTGQIDNNTIIAAVTEWCKSRPQDDIADALMAAVHSLNP